MSKRFLLSGVILLTGALGGAVVWAGCGGTQANNNDAGTPDASTGDAHPDTGSPDAGSDTGTDSGLHDSSFTGGDGAPVVCGTAPCTGGTECCAVPGDGGLPTVACLASCPDGGAPIACDGPAQCTSQNPLCCATAVLTSTPPPDAGADAGDGGGGGGGCGLSSFSSACQATCQTKIQTSCPGTDVVRLCAQTGDCAGDPTYNSCCTVPQLAGRYFCFSAQFAQFAGGSCL